MAKGSVRKKGKKWYYRFYVTDETGKRVQKEFPGTESKRETEALLRGAMEEYANRLYSSRADAITLAGLLDTWLLEDVSSGKLETGTVLSYSNVARQIKKNPLADMRVKKITTEHLQSYIDSLSRRRKAAGGEILKPLSSGTIRIYVTVLKNAFRFAVFPKRYLTFDPMQYVVRGHKADSYQMFDGQAAEQGQKTISGGQYRQIVDYLRRKDDPALLPIQIAYYTGMRLGEVCGLTWEDIDLKGQYLTVRRSLRYNSMRHTLELGPTKYKKIRTIEFGDVLADILRDARVRQTEDRALYGKLGKQAYYLPRQERDKLHYDVCMLSVGDYASAQYHALDLVCRRPDGAVETPHMVQQVCRNLRHKIEGLENFHSHMLRHTYTSNLLAAGAPPVVVQELLGHTEIGTTLGTYAHATNDARRQSVKLLDSLAEDTRPNLTTTP